MSTNKDNTHTKGKVILVGAGPGDPGLITIKGRDALSSADIVVYDFHANPELLKYAPEDAEKIYVGKRGDTHSLEQDDINKQRVEKQLSDLKAVILLFSVVALRKCLFL